MTDCKHCDHRDGTIKKEHGPYLPENCWPEDVPIYRCCKCGLYSVGLSSERTQEKPQ